MVYSLLFFISYRYGIKVLCLQEFIAIVDLSDSYSVLRNFLRALSDNQLT